MCNYAFKKQLTEEEIISLTLAFLELGGEYPFLPLVALKQVFNVKVHFLGWHGQFIYSVTNEVVCKCFLWARSK